MNIKVEDIDYDYLPKWVIAKINPKRNIIDFAKTYREIDEDGHQVVEKDSWVIPLWDNAEDAKVVLEREIGTGRLEKEMEVWHLDALHRAFATYLDSLDAGDTE